MKQTLLVAAALCLLAGCMGPTREDLRDEAISQFQVGRLAEAKETLGVLLNRFPSDPEGLYYLGRVYHSEGNLAQAIFYYRSCLDAQPSFLQAKQWLRTAEEETGQTTEPIRMVR